MIRLLNLQTDTQEILRAYHASIQRMGPELFPEDSPGELDAAFLNLLQSPHVTVFVSQGPESLQGSIGIATVPLVWNPKFLASEEIFWFCHPDAPVQAALGLMKAGYKFMKTSGSKIISMSTMATSPVGVSRVYAGLGLKELQSTYAKVL